MKKTTSWSIEFLKDLSKTSISSGDVETSLKVCERHGVLLDEILSNDLGLSEPPVGVCVPRRERFSKRVARAGSCDLKIEFEKERKLI